MIYRAPERATPARGRKVTHELAALLVGMALLAAIILQIACAGAGGASSRWLCLNNSRLAALRTATATPAPTRPSGHQGAIRPVGVPTTLVFATPTVPPDGSESSDAFPLPGQPGSGLPTPDDRRSRGLAYPSPFGFPTADGGGSLPLNPNAFNERRATIATMTAVAAEALASAEARAERMATPTPAVTTATATPVTPTATITPTPGPGTPSVTPGPSPTALVTPTASGYARP